MQSTAVSNFSLRRTLQSGQFFRYSEDDEGYVLLTMRKRIRVKQKGATLHYDGCDEATLAALFGLDDDYDRKCSRLLRDPVLKDIMPLYPGLRIMRQDLHETILGFICSSQSNIPKIRMNLHLLSQHCGETVGANQYLPAPGTQLSMELVVAAKTGYRAKYLVQTNARLAPELLGAIKAADYGQSHELLCSLPGIGPKIADCICLFALGHGEAFPVDVHIIRAMKALFPKKRFPSERSIKEFAQKRWGKDAGLAQQYIYEWAREHLRP
jgi:N-glycosylase/DNA lyase